MPKKRTVASALAEIDLRLDANELLTSEDREAIKKKAREHVKKKRKEEMEEKLLQAAIEEEERSHNPTEQYEEIVIDLAPYAAYIMLDGTMYFHGVTYDVPFSVARSIEDVGSRTWEHDNEIHGRRRKADMVRQPINRKLQPGHENVSASALNTRASMRE